jgi:uncharacterized protein YndB with AHSA1/START domain
MLHAVDVRSDRRFAFPVGTEELWAALTRVDDYRAWWPWLRRFDAAGFAAGERWRCVVQPPMPYVLRFGISLDEVEAGSHATATIDGDIVGTARLDLLPTVDGCEARLVSHLAPSNAVLRAAAVVARPLVRFGHDWVLDTGLRQFASRAF